MTGARSCPRPLVTAALAALAAWSWAVPPVAASQPGHPPSPADRQPNLPEAEVQFNDGSVLKLRILDDALEFLTPYGPLKIPVKSIHKVELGMRLGDEDAKLIDAALADLTGTVPVKREPAKRALLEIGGKALPALRRAAKSADPDAAQHLEAVIEKLAADHPGDTGRDHDLIVTEDSQIAGRLVAPSIRVVTSQFGEQRIKLADVKVILGPAAAATQVADAGDAVDAPGNMTTYQGQTGTVLRLRVTANPAGSIWGTGTYTLDSHFPTAVVHAGALRPGQTGVVRVRIVASPPGFVGSAKNGVTSSGYGFYPAGGYEILGGRK